MTAPDEAVERVKEARERLLARVRKSISSDSTGSGVVDDAQRGAEFVVNALTVHETGLLAEAAITFAKGDLLAAGWTPPESWEQVGVLDEDGFAFINMTSHREGHPLFRRTQESESHG